jgi:hypothetical protein
VSSLVSFSLYSTKEGKEMQNKLFDLLDHWVSFPNYQLERRADIFFAVHLDQIFKTIRNVEIELIIPEFPIRIGTIYPDVNIDKSYKIDYVVKIKDKNKVVFIELKTDSGSRRESQDKYLQASQDVGFQALLGGLKQIYEVTKYKTKDQSLLKDLSKAGIINFESDKITIPNVKYESEIVYLQPKSNGGKSEIGFKEIASALSSSGDAITKRFCKSLEEWSKN